MARFSDIRRGDELKAANDALQLWQRKTRVEKKALYATAAAVGGGKRLNRNSKTAYIQPFGGADNFWYETKVLAPATDAPLLGEENATALIGAVVLAVGPNILNSLPVGANNVSSTAKKIQFAKVKCTERSGAGTPTTSRLTGLPYTKVNTNTASSPFGSSTAAVSQPLAIKLIRRALMPATPIAGRSVGFTPQGNVGNITKSAP